MKKLVLASAFALAANSAFAGGLEHPKMEDPAEAPATPMAAKTQTASSRLAQIAVPLAVLLVVLAVVIK